MQIARLPAGSYGPAGFYEIRITKATQEATGVDFFYEVVSPIAELPKLFVWDDALFALAKSVDEARLAIAQRLGSFPQLVASAYAKEPVVKEYPATHVIWHNHQIASPVHETSKP